MNENAPMKVQRKEKLFRSNLKNNEIGAQQFGVGTAFAENSV